MGVFTFRAAGEITFGVGAIDRLGTAIKKVGGKRVLVVGQRGQKIIPPAPDFG
jgi:alcohol dehydrogenase YqhD (iron-dependent ADH family)